jgi:hypothetical protein
MIFSIQFLPNKNRYIIQIVCNVGNVSMITIKEYDLFCRLSSLPNKKYEMTLLSKDIIKIVFKLNIFVAFLFNF